jgi:hypothetical protein
MDKTLKISRVFFVSIVVLFMLFTFLLVVGKDIYNTISLEDNLVEYIGFVFLFAAGLFAALASWKNFGLKKPIPASILLGVGILFIVAAFEEISWGQRIFGFDTPEKLLAINDQDEFNFHNIDKRFFDRALDRLNILFVVFTTVMLFLNRDYFLGVRMPDVFLTLSFALIPFYHQYNVISLDFYHLLYLPLLAIFFLGIIQKQHIISLSTVVAFLLTIFLLVFHTEFNDHFSISKNSANEIREMIFSIVCAFYAYLLYVDVKRVKHIS